MLNAILQQFYISQMLKKNFCIELTVFGVSMMPNLKPGIKLIIKKRKKYKIGDIVVYLASHKKNLVIHRIIYKLDDYFITKGDANSSFDPPIHFTEILGAVDFKSLPYITFYGSEWLRAKKSLLEIDYKMRRKIKTSIYKNKNNIRG